MNILDFVLNRILNWINFRPDSMEKWIFKTYRPGLCFKYKLQITCRQQVCQDPRVAGHNFPFPWKHTLSLLDPYINYMLVYFYSLFALSPGVLNALWKVFTLAEYIFSILSSTHFQPADNIPNDLSRNLFLNNAIYQQDTGWVLPDWTFSWHDLGILDPA